MTTQREQENFVILHKDSPAHYDIKSVLTSAGYNIIALSIYLISKLYRLAKTIVRFTTIKPVLWTIASFKYMIFIPCLTLAVYVIELLLIPINAALVLLFDVNLFGLLNYHQFRRSNIHPDDTSNYHRNINNIYNNHWSSNNELYLKQLRRGYAGTRFNQYWSTAANGSKKQVNFWAFIYLIYKFIIMSVIFSSLMAILTGFVMLLTKSLYNGMTFKVIYHKSIAAVKAVLDALTDTSPNASAVGALSAVGGGPSRDSHNNFTESINSKFIELMEDEEFGGSDTDELALISQVYNNDKIKDFVVGLDINLDNDDYNENGHDNDDNDDNDNDDDDDDDDDDDERRHNDGDNDAADDSSSFADAVSVGDLSTTSSQNNDNEEELFADKYSNLEYLRNLKDRASRVDERNKKEKEKSSSEAKGKEKEKDNIPVPTSPSTNATITSKDSTLDKSYSTGSSTAIGTLNNSWFSSNRLGSIDNSITEESEYSETEGDSK